ncbi:hypothetical protein NHF45_01225 [Maricaulaceae bacterium NA33B04]|nr:hypothetical protein [Maricaulaceae bacterium NA33B04]
MSEDKDKLDPEAVIKSTFDRMKAFGYVDRAWVLSAFALYYRDTVKPRDEEKKDDFHLGFFLLRLPFLPLIWLAKGIGRLFAGTAEPDRSVFPDEEFSAKYLRAYQANAGLFRSLLNTLPQPATGLPVQNPRSRGPRVANIDAVLGRANKGHLKRIAKFLRKSGLEETGFPVRLIGDEGDGAPKVAEEEREALAIQRNKALSLLTGGLLYRFAYDQDKALKWEDTGKIFRANGVYRTYVIPPDTGLVERRLLLIKLDQNSTIVRVAELRRRRKKIVARGGYLIPAAGVNTLVLSSDFSTEALREMIKDQLPDVDPQEVFPDEVSDEARSSASFLQEHQLAFFSLVNRGEGEFRGSILEGPAPASVVGYRINSESIQTLREPENEPATLPVEAAGPFSHIDVQYRPRPAELSILEPGDIEDPRDRMLVSAISQNPSVSIDIG